MPDLPIGFAGRFTVNSCARELITVTAVVGGEREIQAVVNGLVVELVPEEAHGKSITLRWVPDDLEAAEAIFQPGADIDGTFREGAD